MAQDGVPYNDLSILHVTSNWDNQPEWNSEALATSCWRESSIFLGTFRVGRVLEKLSVSNFLLVRLSDSQPSHLSLPILCFQGKRCKGTIFRTEKPELDHSLYGQRIPHASCSVSCHHDCPGI